MRPSANSSANSFEEIERVVLLRNVDTLWMDHIDAMEELKRGIGLRGYAQQDPVVAYRLEGFEMFRSDDRGHQRKYRQNAAHHPSPPPGGDQAGADPQAPGHRRRRHRQEDPHEGR